MRKGYLTSYPTSSAAWHSVVQNDRVTLDMETPRGMEVFIVLRSAGVRATRLV